MPLILPGNVASATASTTFSVANSCRFNDGDSPSLTKTATSFSSATTGTFSFWIKRGALGATQYLFANYASGSSQGLIKFNSDDTLTVNDYDGTDNIQLTTNRVFRDPSAWMSIVLRIASSESTEADRARLYINGTQETSFATETYPTSGESLKFFANSASGDHVVGANQSDASNFDGYLAECVYCDGQSLGADSFGEFDSDSPTIFKPIDVSGLTFGNNGWYLDFEDSDNLGDDESGNASDFTSNNLAATDQATDTPTNNFAVMNPFAYRYRSGLALPTYSEGNLKTAFTDGTYGTSTMATIGVTTGKWYWEAEATGINDTCFVGITKAEYDPNANFAGRSMYYGNAGPFWAAGGTGGTTQNPYGNTWTTGDIIGVAFDATNGVIWFSKDGTWQNSATIAEIGAGTTTNAATTGITTGQTWMPFGEGTNETLGFNFGGCPAFTVSSGNADADGYGNFEFAVPDSYFCLCSKNLAEYG